jgi:hypothetical protein
MMPAGRASLVVVLVLLTSVGTGVRRVRVGVVGGGMLRGQRRLRIGPPLTPSERAALMMFISLRGEIPKVS